MTETTARIRWEPTDFGGFTGRVGDGGLEVFRLWQLDRDVTWTLAADLPGESRYADDPDELKRDAEDWLAGFVSLLGAVFPAEREEFEFPRDGLDLEAAFGPGAYVRYQHPDEGWEDDQRTGRQLLTHGRLYRVAWNGIGQSETRIGLVGIKGVTFNSVLFEPVASEDVTDAEAAEVARRSGIGQAASKKEDG